MAAAAPMMVVNTLPGAVAAPTGTAGDTTVSLAFTPLSAAPITGYIITPFIAGSPQTTQTIAGNTSPITATGLTNSTAYTFTLTAYNTYGLGPVSAASNSVTPTPSTFNPNIPGAALTLWLDASNSGSLTLSGSTVNTWTDLQNSLSGTGGANKGTNTPPQYVSNVYKSSTMPCVRFTNANNTYVDFGTSTTLQFGPNFTIFATCNVTTTATQSYVFARSILAAAASRVGIAFFTSWLLLINSANSGNVYNFTNPSTSTLINFCWTVNMGTGSMLYYINGTLTSTVTVATGTLAGGYRFLLGNYNDASGGIPSTGQSLGFNGDICEFLMYKTVLGSTDRAAVESYLRTKWGAY